MFSPVLVIAFMFFLYIIYLHRKLYLLKIDFSNFVNLSVSVFNSMSESQENLFNISKGQSDLMNILTRSNVYLPDFLDKNKVNNPLTLEDLLGEGD